MNFEQLGLGPELLQALEKVGYKLPTPVQVQAIPQILIGHDVLGCAQTGTGKTASFTLPMIEILSTGRSRARMARSLILTPTRELATQISEMFETYGKFSKLTMALLIGGVSLEDQNRKLDLGVDVLIATPGRLIDHLERGHILLNDIKILVIDEADRMLDLGFMPDVERIVSKLPSKRQTLFFSATIPPEIQSIASNFLNSPKKISVTPNITAAETVQQFLLRVKDGDWVKRDTLRKLIKAQKIENALVFCNRKRDVEILNKSLKKHGFKSAALHGDMSQPERYSILNQFKLGEFPILVASDVAARGLDLPNVSHVFNFDVPTQAQDYVHRIGRTGRAGRKGLALTIATNKDKKFIEAVENFIGAEIKVIKFPDGNTSNDKDQNHKSKTKNKNCFEKPKNQKTPKKSKTSNEFIKLDQYGEEKLGMGPHIPAFMLRSSNNKDD